MKKLSIVRRGMLAISLLVSMASAGCGGDGDSTPADMGQNTNQDMGGQTQDMGQGQDMGQSQDMGSDDEGVDGGEELPEPQVRVVHAVSDLTKNDPAVPINGIRLCVDTGFGVIAQPANDPNLLPNIDLSLGLPHRAVTPYQQTLPPATVRVYDEERVDNDDPGALPPKVDCPVSHDGSTPAPGTTVFDGDCTNDTVPCLFQFTYDPSSLEDGESYSLIVHGFVDNTNNCRDLLNQPVSCPNGAVGATLEQDEDADDVVAGSARARFFHGIYNLWPVDVCYDADGIGTGAPAVAVHTNVSPGTITDYATVPVLPPGSAMVFLTLKDQTDAPTLLGPCAFSANMAMGSSLPANVVPVFFSPENAAMMPPNPATNVVAGTTFTIFATGDTRFAAPPTMADNYAQNYPARTPVVLAFTDFAPPTP